jgi:hypothetical protein
MVAARAKTSDMEGLVKLNFWGSDLTDISIVRQFKRAEVLSFSLNMIATLSHFQFCTNLRELYIRRNRIQDLREVCYLTDLPNLKTLLLSENPCCDSAGNLYRPTVIRALPNLDILDNEEVTPTDREDALELGLILEHPGQRKNKQNGLGPRIYESPALLPDNVSCNSCLDCANANDQDDRAERKQPQRPSTATTFLQYRQSPVRARNPDTCCRFFGLGANTITADFTAQSPSTITNSQAPTMSNYGFFCAPTSPAKSSKNLVSAVVSLIDELDADALNVVESAVKKRQQQLLS